MTGGHYEFEPETVVRVPGILRIYWVEPGETPRRTHFTNMAAPRLVLLAQAVTAYMAAHPDAAREISPDPDPDNQTVPMPRRQ
jgi:hypothetical protein